LSIANGPLGIQLDVFEIWLYWLGGAAALVALLMAVLGFRRAARRPAGYQSGPAARWLRFPVILFSTLLFIYIGYVLWKPLPLNLSPQVRLAFDLAGALIYFPALALYLWGLASLGEMFTASSGFGVRLPEGQGLVTGGPYGYVRHPMYLAVILAGIGGLLLYRTWSMLIFAVMMFGLVMRARREEQALRDLLGDQWCAYTRRVPAWLPRFARKG
jgi:protein-S-isoprenylcysteine O-methyltransferase Ste14